MLNAHKVYFFIFALLLCVKYTIELPFSYNLELYMLAAIVFVAQLNKRLIPDRFYFFEYIYGLLFVWLAISATWAPNHSLSIKALLGEFIIVIGYFIFRYLTKFLSINAFERLFLLVAYSYIAISIILYCAGLISYFVFGGLSGCEYKILGVLVEGKYLRFTGLGESPADYAIYASLFLCFFIFKRKPIMASITFATILMSLSGIFYIILLGSILIYAFWMHGRIRMYYLLVAFTVGCILVLAYTVPLISLMTSLHMNDVVLDRLGRLRTGSGRFELWEFVYGLIKQNPIAGYGLNQNRLLVTPFRSGLSGAHNTLLDIILMSGVIGGLLYAFMLSSFYMISYRLAKYHNNQFFILLFFSYCMFSMSNNLLYMQYNILYIGMLYFYYDNMITLKRAAS